MKVLAIDVGGTHVKVLASGQQTPQRFVSGPKMTAKQIVSGVKRLAAVWSYDVVSIGYPGPVLHGRILHDPHNLGRGWVNFDFKGLRTSSSCIERRRHASFGQLSRRKHALSRLGNGSRLRHDCGRMPRANGTRPPSLSQGDLRRLYWRSGSAAIREKKWRKYVAEVVKRLAAALEPDDFVLGGGNVKQLKPLPKGCRQGDNANAFLGGFWLWTKGNSP